MVEGSCCLPNISKKFMIVTTIWRPERLYPVRLCAKSIDAVWLNPFMLLQMMMDMTLVIIIEIICPILTMEDFDLLLQELHNEELN
jgi:hypothetical protein